MVPNVSRWPGKFPVSLTRFRIVWLFSGWSGKFPNSLESFQMVCKVFDDPEKSGIMPKAFRMSSNILSRNRLDHTFFVAKTIFAHFFVAKTIHAHLFCRKNNFCTLFCRTNDLRRLFCRDNDLRTFFPYGLLL